MNPTAAPKSAAVFLLLTNHTACGQPANGQLTVTLCRAQAATMLRIAIGLMTALAGAVFALA
jgi:hypothetical protein